MGANLKYIARRVLVGFLALGAVFLFATAQTGRAADSAIFSFIDVGQGDSALLSASNGFNVLIDGGVPAAGPTVVAYLRSQGMSTKST